MSGGGNATDDCVSLAIAFHQAPGRFSDLLHGRAELPKGIGKLLRLAGGAEAEGVNGQAFVPAAEIRQAARFFIEQVLLAHEADHYRVLGVRPDANENGHFGYWVGRPYWGQGLATAATRAAVAILFAQTDQDAVWATHMAGNVASARVMAKCGLVVVRQETRAVRGAPCAYDVRAITRDAWEALRS